jgi:hypothetical protein
MAVIGFLCLGYFWKEGEFRDVFVLIQGVLFFRRLWLWLDYRPE